MALELTITGNLSFYEGGKLWFNHLCDDDLAKFARHNITVYNRDATKYVAITLPKSIIGSDPDPFSSYVGKICRIIVRLRKFTLKSQFNHNYGTLITGNTLVMQEISLSVSK